MTRKATLVALILAITLTAYSQEKNFKPYSITRTFAYPVWEDLSCNLPLLQGSLDI